MFRKLNSRNPGQIPRQDIFHVKNSLCPRSIFVFLQLWIIFLLYIYVLTELRFTAIINVFYKTKRQAY